MKFKFSIKLLLLIPFLTGVSTNFAEPLAVSTIAIKEESSYQFERVYGGQIKPQRQSTMGFETGGTIFKVHVQEGDEVTKGQSLITLDQSAIKADLEGARAGLEAAKATVSVQKAQLELSRLTLKRHRELSKNGHVSKQQLDELSQQRRINSANLLVANTQLSAQKAQLSRVQIQLNKSVLRAPYDAVIQSQLVDEGSIVNPGMPAINLVESDKVEAIVGIPQQVVHFLNKDKIVDFIVNNERIQGKLKAILPQIDQTTGTVTSIFTLDGGHLYSGSLTEMRLTVKVKEKGFWIPLASLAESQRGLWSVLVISDHIDQSNLQPTVESRLVEIIHRGKNNVFVRGTLSNGDLIIDSGTGRVVPGQSVRIASRNSLSLVSGR